MAGFAVIADDLTGANGTGVLLVKNDLKILSVVNYIDLDPGTLQTCNGIVVNTCSRGINHEEARKRVKENAEVLLKSGIQYFGKRIDSTIRGNLGAEIEGMLSALESEYVAFVVPAYPDLGRVVVGGILLVDGVPVQLTSAGSDPKTPVRSSSVSVEITRQTSLPVGGIHLNDILQGPEILRKRILEEVSAGKKIVVIDALTESDIAQIARAVQEAGIKAVAVDPGPFSKAMIAGWLSKPGSSRGKVMVVSGSATSLTRDQLEHIEQEQNGRFVDVDVRDLLESGSSKAQEYALACRVYGLSNETGIFGLRVAPDKEAVLDLAGMARKKGVTVEELAGLITSALGRIAHQVLGFGVKDLKGVYLTGGDMTVDFCRTIGAKAIELKGEVIPLAASGIIIGGEYDGLRVVTKGGLVGGRESGLKCVEYLLDSEA